MTTLPYKKCSAMQINPYLGIILSSNMEGWFMERYVNLFMIGSIIDYIDNVNYHGLIIEKRIYSFDDIKVSCLSEIIANEIERGNYLNVWVDEFYIPYSFRYQKIHFVHPLLVYGYDWNTNILKSVFFDILKGQTLVDLSFQDVCDSLSCLNQFYYEGGSEKALINTITAFSPSPFLTSDFHINVFTKQLSNYLCCESDAEYEWFTSCREGVFESKEKLYGIQIYDRIITYLQSPNLSFDLHFKAMHDFVIHKKVLLERFRYIQETFITSTYYSDLIDSFSNIYLALEKMRLLNIKNQIKKGLFPASLCLSSSYLCSLIETLKKCYKAEQDILPLLHNYLITLEYQKKHIDESTIISLEEKALSGRNNYIEYIIDNTNIYIYRFDIVLHGNELNYNSFDYILLNDSMKFYINVNSFTNYPVRSFNISPVKITSLKLYTNTLDCQYSINLYPLPNQIENTAQNYIELDDSWHGFHHLKRNNDQILKFIITDEDPFMIQDNIGLNADEYPYLHIEMSTTAKTIYAQIYFSTIDSPHVSVDKSLFFKIIPDGKTHSYFINMSANINWRGFVKAIRFDPAQFHDAYEWDKKSYSTCTIEKIGFMQAIPNGTRECMTAMNLKDDGSTFKI